MITLKYRPHWQYLTFVIVYILTACAGGPQIADGQVYSLYHSTAEWIIDGCMAGECGSHIYVKDQLIVYARPFIDNVAFVVTSKGIPVEKLTGLTGNLVNCGTWACFQEWLASNGFTVVSTAAPLYQTALSIGAELATMEFLPVFSIILTPDTLPEWIAPETFSE